MNKKIKNPIHGWLAVDKPMGMTSSQVVGRLKWLLKPAKIGHAGTLDPMATGCLPIALGEATKTTAYCMDKHKTYRFTIAFGAATDSGDKEGEVIEQTDARPTQPALENVLEQFVGHIRQVPPAYAAIKIDGERAYARARRGEVVEMPSREVHVTSLILESFTPNEATLVVGCGKGTYVRSLGRDIAVAAGSLGHLNMLRRLDVGIFTEESLILLDSLEDFVYEPTSGEKPEWLLPLDTVLDDIPVVQVQDPEAVTLHHGNNVPVAMDDIELVRAKCGQKLVALAKVEDGLLKPKRVFNH